MTKHIFNITALIFSILFLINSASGISYLSKNNITIEKSAIADDIVNADAEVKIDGQVYGTVYVVNSTLTIGGNAAINGNIIVMGGKLILNPNAYIGSKMIIIGAEVKVTGTSDGLGFLKANYRISYSKDIKKNELDFLRKYLVFSRPIPRLNKDTLSLKTDYFTDNGFDISGISYPEQWSIAGLMNVDMQGQLQKSKVVSFKNNLNSAVIGIFHFKSFAFADQAWNKIKETDENKVNYSCHISIGDGAHWFFRYKNSLYLLWYKRGWMFAFTISFNDNSVHSEADWNAMEKLRDSLLNDFIKTIKQ